MTMIASTSIDSTIEFNDRVHHSSLLEQHFHISMLTFLSIQLWGHRGSLSEKHCHISMLEFLLLLYLGHWGFFLKKIF